MNLKDCNDTHRSGWPSKKIPNKSQASRSYLRWLMLERTVNREGERVPVSPSEDRDGARNGVCLSGICLDTDPSRLGKAKEVIHDLKPLVTLRVVSTTDINAALKLALRVVPQEGKYWDNCAWANVECEFVLVNRELLNKLGETLHKVGSVCVEGVGSFSMLDYRRIWGSGFRKRRDGG